MVYHQKVRPFMGCDNRAYLGVPDLNSSGTSNLLEIKPGGKCYLDAKSTGSPIAQSRRARTSDLRCSAFSTWHVGPLLP